MECTDIWQPRIRVSVKSPENIYAYFQSAQNVSGSHSPSNCSMRDGEKKFTGMKGPESEADNLLPPIAEFTIE